MDKWVTPSTVTWICFYSKNKALMEDSDDPTWKGRAKFSVSLLRKTAVSQNNITKVLNKWLIKWVNFLGAEEKAIK